jgi:hypothetical protein
MTFQKIRTMKAIPTIPRMIDFFGSSLLAAPPPDSGFWLASLAAG